MSESALNLNPLAGGIATTILQGFNRHFEIFQQITSGARQRFEDANWDAVQAASQERIVLYDRRVKETIETMRELYHITSIDPELWREVKYCYMRQLLDHQQPELAETFYTSVFCHHFPRQYYTNTYIFVRSSMSTEYVDSEETSYVCYYPHSIGLREAITRILKNAGFGLPFENLGRDLRNIYRAIVQHYPGKASRKAQLNFQLSVIRHPFFRNKAAYIVGRMINGRDDIAFALPILNNENGGLYIDTLLLGEKQLSVVFSYSQAYFMMEHQVPSAVVSFLQQLLPRRNTSELYSAIGLHKQGKSAFYRDFLHHLRHSSDAFVIAPGIRGMVMMVFTLPSYPYVFKIIKDKFAPQKEFTRQQVEAKYQLVKRHDRVGRMADMLEYSNVVLPVERFVPELLQELQETCASSISFDGDSVIFRHIYLERRMIPLNIFIETADDALLERVIEDYGNAIKQLAGANIFPGDFLYKNFGVTQLGRVVFYDYDEITYMTECNFRKIPPPRFPEDEFRSEPWYSIEPNDVFPEEFGTFLLSTPRIRKSFLKYHRNLLDARYWQAKKDKIVAGQYEDVFPYPEALRFKR
ncbi:MAG: bifunctional isocitrate dehydrogenase kinase/phosphatase [Pseudomonadota bacterium]|jgi:isocitrate dehydrogenase kinase/phosphatase|uniref:Isocitrate dehydrogenase kinase/phosphatase n=1 Tax=Thiothrix fructosivorans TaxID=111770 RepID=A0A8B0SPE0_9GAMM|nr:bifunctional isocitrate dehydrogenase kinase/phosphatase [Thiothrix fructosivorans]MBO0611561.1 bifunctional isocitrate dehydrogenase kinase/phosphatase [Thiothrix fructosivorans]QTX10772.1 bifunctional isocitrate dehydrogenase kinase/phosphatase [Thiothrix fructosivorans]